MNHKLFTVLAALTLSACGGGSEQPAPSIPEPVPVQACNHVVNIQLFGDSTQWGYLAEGGGVRASVYPELALQQLMDLRFGRGAVVVSTRAVSGTNSGNLIAGTDGVNKPWPQSVDADIVVINHGINDVAWKVSPDAYRDHLRQLSHAPAQVVFETPLPVSTVSVEYSGYMKQVAAEEGLPVVDARAYVQSLPDWWQYATDGVHATSEGYAIVAKGALMPVLEPLVAVARCK